MKRVESGRVVYHIESAGVRAEKCVVERYFLCRNTRKTKRVKIRYSTIRYSSPLLDRGREVRGVREIREVRGRGERAEPSASCEKLD